MVICEYFVQNKYQIRYYKNNQCIDSIGRKVGLRLKLK